MAIYRPMTWDSEVLQGEEYKHSHIRCLTIYIERACMPPKSKHLKSVFMSEYFNVIFELSLSDINPLFFVCVCVGFISSTSLSFLV